MTKSHSGGIIFKTTHLRCDGRTFPVETSARQIEIDGWKYFQAIVRDISEQKRTEERLGKLNRCLLAFGADLVKNINSLVELCGQLLGATSALYNRLEGDVLHSVGWWNVAEDINAYQTAKGHICSDLINSRHEHLRVIRKPHETECAKTDPAVQHFRLKTHVGKGVRFGDETTGSLCAVFREDFVPTSRLSCKRIFGF